jgi:hypothetical protein
VFWTWFLGVSVLFWTIDRSNNDFFNSLEPFMALLPNLSVVEDSYCRDDKDDTKHYLEQVKSRIFCNFLQEEIALITS